MQGRILIAGLVLCCALGSAAGGPKAWAQDAGIDRGDWNERFVPGEVIVRFEPGATAEQRRGARADAGVEFERALELPAAQVVEVDGSVGAAVARLRRQPEVAYAQPNYRYQGLAPDTFIDELWGLEDSAAPNPGVNALAAWSATRGAGQVIAVVDSGVDLTHPDVSPNLWANPGETPGNGLDDDANGVVDDVRGADFVERDDLTPTGDPDDFEFHGTHVAGTAAGQDENGLGTAGVAPDARIMAVRVLDGDGGGSSADIGEGIAYAALEGADVINLSLGGSGASDPFMSEGVDIAAQRGAVVVAAAGNDGSDNDHPATPTVPCNLPHSNLICVAALNETGNLAAFSNFGSENVDVAAPGTGILSAKTDWGAPVMTESFDSPLDGWDQFTAPGSTPWGLTNSPGRFTEGTHSATDSPPGVNYANGSDSELFTAEPIDLTGRRGCRMHFDLAHEIEPRASNGALRDFLFAGALTDDADVGDGLPFSGTSAFSATEVSISDLDGRADVYPAFALLADGNGVVADGAYVDRLRTFCRDTTYVNAISPASTYEQASAGSYVRFAGTSMATPHVSGVAALVRAVDPGAGPEQVIAAIEQGVRPLPSLTGQTATGGAVDAVRAIDAALDMPNTTPVRTTPPPPAPPPSPVAPGRPNFGKVSVSRRGVVAIVVRGDTGNTGVVTLTARIARATRLRRVARRAFAIPSSGRAVVKLRLSRLARRQLQRRGRLRVSAKAVVRNDAGLRSSRTEPFRLRLRRR